MTTLLCVLAAILIALVIVKRRKERRDYEGLKGVLKRTCDELVAELTDAPATELTNRLNGSLAQLSELDKQYSQGKGSNAGAEALSAIASTYGKTVQEASQAAEALLSKVAMKRMAIDTILKLMVMFHVRLLKADEPEIIAMMEPGSKLMEPLRQASRVLVPVLSVARPAIEARVQTEGKLSEPDETEEYIKAAAAVLQGRAETPAN